MNWINPLDAVKAAQIAQAEAQGVEHPYKNAVAPATATGKPSALIHYQAQLANDLVRLKAIADIPDKIIAKRDMVTAYLPFVEDYITSGKYYPNPIAVQVMIWLFDIGDIENALKLALVLIAQRQQMPDRFNSTMETFVCDYTYDWANKLLVDNQSASPYLDQVVEQIDLNHWDLHPAVASKMYALLAKFKFADNNFEKTVALCTQAETINPEGAGVKTLKAKAQAKL
jgi:hypothetical protein